MLFDKVLEEFKKIHPHYSRTPSEKFSSARMGGWLLRDADDMYIGFLSKRGGCEVVDLVETTPENKPQIRGVNDEKYKEFKQRYKK
jgi:hypothetical protein